MPYKHVPRSRWTGPRSIGTSMELREDMYSVVFLYKLKRKTLYKDGVEESERTLKTKHLIRASETIENKSNFYKDFRYFKKMMTGKWRFMVLTQLLLIWFLGYEAVTSEDTVEAFKSPAENGSIILTRFLCAIVLHVTLTDEITQGFNMMKYSANHPWKFDNYFEAYFVGLAQALVVLSVETVNLAVLNTNHTIMDILMNFLALVIISDFDDYFFITIKNDKMAKLVSDGELEIPEDGIEGDNKIELSEVLKV